MALAMQGDICTKFRSAQRFYVSDVKVVMLYLGGTCKVYFYLIYIFTPDVHDIEVG